MMISKCLLSPNNHYSDVIMSSMASQITSVSIVKSTVCSGVDEKKKHQSSASLAFVRRIYRWRLNPPHKGLVTRKTFPFRLGEIYMHRRPEPSFVPARHAACWVPTDTKLYNGAILIVNWAIKNKLQWNLNQNTNIFFKKVHLKVASKISAIWFRSLCVQMSIHK